MYQGPMIFGCVIPIVMSQAKGKDLLFHFLQRQFVILPHLDELFDLLILFRRDMDRTVITMDQAAGNQRRVAFIGFYFFPASQLWHCDWSKDNTLHIILGKLVV